MFFESADAVPGFLVVLSEEVQPEETSTESNDWKHSFNTQTLYCCFPTAFPPMHCIYTLRIYVASALQFEKWLDSPALFGFFTPKNTENVKMKKKMCSYLGKPHFSPSVMAAADFIRNSSVLAATSVKNVLLHFMLQC